MGRGKGHSHGIDPVLHLHDDTSVLLDRPRAVADVEQALRLLQRHAAVLAPAAVHLEGLLVRVNVDLDARPGAAQSRHGPLFAPVEGAVLVPVREVAGVVAGAVVPAVPEPGQG